MHVNQNRFREFLLLIGLCGFFFFFRLSGFGLLGPDEPRYAQIAREMLMRYDWVTPILYGHTWLEKPILLYWGEMLSYRIFGVSDWAARVPSAVAATLLVFGTFLAVRRIRHEARLDAALAIASSVLVLGFSRAASTDMLLAAPFCLSLLAWFCWYQSWMEQSALDVSASPVKPWLVLFYALNALAMLAKGPVAPALAIFVIIAFCASQRNFKALLLTLDPVGIIVFLAVAAPWYVLVQLRTPEFFSVFFLKNNLARFGSNLYRHKQPFWYYIPVALIASLPWIVWVLHGLSDGFRGMRSELSNGARPVANDAEPAYTFEIFLFLWAVIPIAFFSLSGSKLPGYILPAIPPLLILAALAVHRRAGRDERPGRLAIFVHAALLAAIAAALVMAPRLMFKLPATAASMMVAAFAGTAVFLIVAIPLLTSGWRMLRFVTLLPLILAVGFLLRGLAPAVDATQSSRPIADLLQIVVPHTDRSEALPVSTFYLNRNTAFGLAFYLDRRVVPYEGLEVSPAVYEIQASIPSSAHILVTREGSLPALSLLLPNRGLRFLGSHRAQRIEIYEVSAAPVRAGD
ncbi:MAG TPA: glycosyltransferase family 39 protein [Candidatus Saccharimonadales bacterium]|nr:glycosyltransferase family 39 protein [Candidatus Saccharimonadales bacterium]